MTIAIRPPKSTDLPALLLLNTQWGYNSTETALKEQLEYIGRLDNAALFVAELNGQVAGRIFVAAHITFGSTSFAEVHGLVVEENFRRRGVGKALIERAKQWSKEKGFNIMKLRTNAKRVEANAFYPSIGFQLEKQQNVFSIAT